MGNYFLLRICLTLAVTAAALTLFTYILSWFDFDLGAQICIISAVACLTIILLIVGFDLMRFVYGLIWKGYT